MVGTGEAVLGVDGCPGGWVGALVRGRSVQWLVFPDASAILAADAAVIAIDIPIGLPEPGPGCRRRADLEAREFLGAWAARNSVYFTPVRQILGVATYPEANALCRQLTGMGLAKQTWNITARGIGQRISALTTCFDMTDALADVPVGPGFDDCLDACAAAWSAQRWAAGKAHVFGASPSADPPTDVDRRGRPVRIVA